MNEPDTARFWLLDGPPERTAAHLREQAALDYAAGYLGVLDGEPVSYWEVYRADLDPLLTGRYPAKPHDAGLHLLIGPKDLRGRGLGRALITEVADRVLYADAAATRVLAEPDVRNESSIRAFTQAGFLRLGDIHLTDKRAALMVRDRDP